MGTSVEGQNHNAPTPPREQTIIGNDNVISFRVRPEQLAFFRRLADFLYQNGFIPEPSLNRMAHMAMLMLGKKFEKQEAANLQRYVEKRFADARAKADPRFRDQGYLYVQPPRQPQPQPQQPVQPQPQPQAAPRPNPHVSTVPPSLRKPSVLPQINDDWLWQDSNQQEGGY
jgi:hypothetical protein